MSPFSHTISLFFESETFFVVFYLFMNINRSLSINYVYSCDISSCFRVKICSLEGFNINSVFTNVTLNQFLSTSIFDPNYFDFYVVCQIFDDGVPICSPVVSSYNCSITPYKCVWNHWICFAIPCKYLTRKSILVFTIYLGNRSSHTLVFGGTSLPIFDDWGVCQTGILTLKVWTYSKGCGLFNGCTTPGHIIEKNPEMRLLSEAQRMYSNGQISNIDWLDRISFPQIEKINEYQKKNSPNFYLSIQFPSFSHIKLDENVIMVYFEPNGEECITHIANYELSNIKDYSVDISNLIEQKHRNLIDINLNATLIDRHLIPSTAEKAILNQIISYPPYHVFTSYEKLLLYQYRYSLILEPTALPKFLQSVDFSSIEEMQHALNLLKKWKQPSPGEALELLKPVFTLYQIRQYAVLCLDNAEDEEILNYLFQLVQAIRYESDASIADISRCSNNSSTILDNNSGNSNQTFQSLNYSEEQLVFDKSIVTESNLSSDNSLFQLQSNIYSVEPNKKVRPMDKSNQQLIFDSTSGDHNLVSFLIRRCSKSSFLAFYFYWYLSVECCDFKNSEFILERFKVVSSAFNRAVKDSRNDIFRNICKQKDFVDNLVKNMKIVKDIKSNYSKKTEKLRSFLSNKYENQIIDMPLFVSPSSLIKYLQIENISIIKSNTQPIILPFTLYDNSTKKLLFKRGDDLRQDHLVLQLVSLMDYLMKREGLDLKLSLYRVQPVYPIDGFVEIIEDSSSVQEILSKDGNIQSFLRKFNPDDKSSNGIRPEVMDNYIRSLAGYCVASYLLGIGDRHLENLLITVKGKFFHIDFGYIFGRDPKPFAPPMKLSKEMVEAMGGASSTEYNLFRGYCYSAFIILRQNANLILNLLSLMVDANIPDIALEPDKTVLKVQEKFMLELNEEEAIQTLQNLIDDSVKAMFPVVVDQMHKWAQYWKR